MSEFKPDLTRIKDNPFSFQGPERAGENLERSLIGIARFFREEISDESRLYDAWNRYQGLHGNSAVVKFSTSLKHVMGIQDELVFIRKCEKKHVTERLERLIILLHIGLIELLEGGLSENFRQWVIRKVSTAG